MGRIATTEAVSPFGEWLEEIMRDYGLNRKMLAARAGVGTTTVSNWIAGLRSPKKSTIESIVAAISSDENAQRSLLSSGLQSAGFSFDGDLVPIEYKPIMDELHQASYDGGVDGEFVEEIADYIRVRAERRQKKQGRA